MKKIIYPILLISWMTVIFCFSNQNGVKSQGLSDNLINKVIDISNNNMSKSNRRKIISNVSFLIRKLAHFTEYLILGILIYLVISVYGLKKVILFSILFIFIYACSDEIHQLFSDGRSAKVLDVFIDTIGGSTGIFLLNLHKTCKINKKGV